MANHSTKLQSCEYLDPITGEAAAHPIGTGIGAAVGGVALGAAGTALAATGTALGAVAGPVGAVAGAIAGGLVGHRLAESMHPIVPELADEDDDGARNQPEAARAENRQAVPAGPKPSANGGSPAAVRRFDAFDRDKATGTPSKVDCHGLTDVGRVRPANEDQFLIASLNRSMLIHQTSLAEDDHTRLVGASQGLLLVVADGMGGHAAGEQASAIAVKTLEHYVLNTASWCFRLQGNQADDCTSDLKAALEACQQGIQAAADANVERRGMGTTLTMAYVVWPRLYVVHVGDSRCYLLRPPRLEQVTTDHTLAQQLVDQKAITPEAAIESRWSHVLWNCLGGDSSELHPEVYKATLQVGDTLLLCTDGLTGKVRDEQLLNLIQQGGSTEETCRRLVDAANEAGGRDNITVVVARFLA